MPQQFQLWQNAWREDRSAHITVQTPDNWNVQYCHMPADEFPPMSRKLLRERICTPAAMPSIRQMAAAGKQAVIVFDDLSRGTPVQTLAELVIEQLLEGGMTQESISFLCALGNHGPMTRADFVCKLGEQIVESFPIYNHNPYEQLVKVGVDSDGEDVLVNRMFMDCDIRIGIGSVSPHPLNGFGGGGKLLFPGIAGIRTTRANHTRRQFIAFSPEKCGLRRDIEAMTDMVRPFFKIDAILNSRLEIVDLYAGDPVEEYYRAVDASMQLNTMQLPEEKADVVFVNANAKYNEALIAVRIGAMALKPGGDLVLINHCQSGQVVHYLYSAFGPNYGGGCWTPYAKRTRSDIGRIIYYTPYPDVTSRMSLNEPDKVVFAKTWQDVQALLACHGPGTAAAIIPDGTISRFTQ